MALRDGLLAQFDREWLARERRSALPSTRAGCSMQGMIAQAVALIIHGNAALQGARAFDAATFYPANSTFNFCESVHFLEREGQNWASYAADPVAWIQRLKDSNVSSLRMTFGPSGQTDVADRMLVGLVGGGGRWLIEAAGRGTDYWEARWKVGDRTRADRKIWQVGYCRIAQDQALRKSEPADPEQIKGELADTLTKIAAFARAHKLDAFANLFDQALSLLSSNNPYEGVFHKDLAPPHFLPLAADQLLGAAQAAWVFGGMGSWNDMASFGEDQQSYDTLSEQLYQLLNRATVAAANSSAGPAKKD